jgi:hypothetical protein
VIAGVFVLLDGSRLTMQELLRKSIFKQAIKNYSNSSPCKNWKIMKLHILIDSQTYPIANLYIF